MGIDPSTAKGLVCAWYDTRGRWQVYRTQPTHKDSVALINAHQLHTVIAMARRDGVRAAMYESPMMARSHSVHAKLAACMGQTLLCLSMVAPDFTLGTVHPSTWRAALNLRVQGTDWKNVAYRAVQARYGLSIDNDDVADAILVSTYGSLSLSGHLVKDRKGTYRETVEA